MYRGHQFCEKRCVRWLYIHTHKERYPNMYIYRVLMILHTCSLSVSLHYLVILFLCLSHSLFLISFSSLSSPFFFCHFFLSSPSSHSSLRSNGRLFWVDSTQLRIMSSSLNGSNIEIIASSGFRTLGTYAIPACPVCRIF